MTQLSWVKGLPYKHKDLRWVPSTEWKANNTAMHICSLSAGEPETGGCLGPAGPAVYQGNSGRHLMLTSGFNLNRVHKHSTSKTWNTGPYGTKLNSQHLEY